MGKRLAGIYDLARQETLLFDPNNPDQRSVSAIKGLDQDMVDARFSAEVSDTQDEISLLQADGRHFDREYFLEGELTPVFFGSAMNNFGVIKALEALFDDAPSPRARLCMPCVVARPMSCMPGYSEVINTHIVGSLTIPRASIKWV